MIKQYFLTLGIVISFGLFLYVLTAHAPVHTNSNTNRSASITLADLCSDCSIVGGTEEASTIIDIHTGATRPRIITPSNASTDLTHNRYFSPSKSQEAVVSEDAKSIYIVNFSNGLARLIYTAPAGLGIGTLTWTSKEDSIFFGQGKIVEGMFPYANASNFLKINLQTRTTEEIVRTSQLGKGATNVIIIAVTTDGKKLLFFVGTSPVLWDTSTHHVTALDVPPTTSTQFVAPSSDGLENDPKFIGALMWIENSTVHILQLGDFKETTHKLHFLSSTPGLPAVSSPSPAGDLIVYLQHEPSKEGQALILLNLLTGEERTLATGLTIDPSVFGPALWIPDETKIVWPKVWNGGSPQYEAISVDPNAIWEKPKVISDPLLPNGYGIEGFFYKRPAQ